MAGGLLLAVIRTPGAEFSGLPRLLSDSDDAEIVNTVTVTKRYDQVKTQLRHSEPRVTSFTRITTRQGRLYVVS